ncbi:unnamed protein product [Nyctereutes procyonoides]|uniref:(raccoon dog) hypothetical protein n=1 Tax=Nyctereutes procyonoides TaxID=34880 RepID=A0A811Y049_NYCPR|nr:unnamed protein product [Nyctereutes procyonoides]
MLDSYFPSPFPKSVSHLPPLIALLLPPCLKIFTRGSLGGKSNRSPQMSSEKKRNPGRSALPTAELFIRLTKGHPQKQKTLRRWIGTGGDPRANLIFLRSRCGKKAKAVHRCTGCWRQKYSFGYSILRPLAGSRPLGHNLQSQPSNQALSCPSVSKTP